MRRTLYNPVKAMSRRSLVGGFLAGRRSVVSRAFATTHRHTHTRTHATALMNATVCTLSSALQRCQILSRPPGEPRSPLARNFLMTCGRCAEAFLHKGRHHQQLTELMGRHGAFAGRLAARACGTVGRASRRRVRWIRFSEWWRRHMIMRASLVCLFVSVWSCSPPPSPFFA